MQKSMRLRNLSTIHSSIIPAPDLLLLSTLDLAVVEDTDVVEDVEFWRLLAEVWDVVCATREVGCVRAAPVVVVRVEPDIPVPERLDADEADVEFCNANERVGVDLFLSSSLLVLPDDLWK